ncbi:MAG TPA: RNA-binding transcriptional accessory protein, partial [Candidatus Wallbacteria bacterium]|nr:RNA-binding transcriptional accessory protein [Candidatus Wallbacteria bacterium]
MLLKHISGLNETQAVSIVKYRNDNGKFTSRKALKKVPKIGEKTFEQAAGFIKVAESSNILDSTWVHPESYEAAEKMMELAGVPHAGLKGTAGLAKVREAFLKIDEKKIPEFAEKLGISILLASDIAAALKKPGLDPREELPPIMLKSDVLSISDIKVGMKLTGTVRNVVDFGAFVDIGVKNDGLC